ncbi:hypothetical protein GA0071314_1442 [Halomonas sp. HL-93]|nr:MAG: hypothetical protein HLUCCO06_05965 [Halomonas sp. HL-93]SBR47905.1 hypothetical protein GA0071314_1442 [Halomonas sp. HL-93]SNY95664.1 hypothetical protein SAMN04488142_0172 [Halomonas sp. hl-4]
MGKNNKGIAGYVLDIEKLRTTVPTTSLRTSRPDDLGAPHVNTNGV